MKLDWSPQGRITVPVPATAHYGLFRQVTVIADEGMRVAVRCDCLSFRASLEHKPRGDCRHIAQAFAVLANTGRIVKVNGSWVRPVLRQAF